MDVVSTNMSQNNLLLENKAIAAAQKQKTIEFTSTSTLSLVLLLSIVCLALFSSRLSPQVNFYIHHKSDAAVAIFTLSPIIIVYRQ